MNKINEGDAKEIKKELKTNNYSYPIFEIKSSKVFKNLVDDGKSISQYVKDGGLKAYSYKPVSDQLNKLIQYLNKGK